MGKFNLKDFFANFLNRQELEEEYDYENEHDFSLDMQDYDDMEYEEDEDDYIEEDDDERDEAKARSFLFPRKKEVTRVPDSSTIKMRIIKPNDFDEASEVCSLLKAKNSVILNLDSLTKESARRFLDYVSGAVDITSGKISKISNSIFVIAPYNYDIVNEIIYDTQKRRTDFKITKPWA